MALALAVGLVGGRLLFSHKAGATTATPTTTSTEAARTTTTPTTTSTEAARTTTTTTEPPPTTQPSTKRPIGGDLMTEGEGFTYQSDWFVQGEALKTAGQQSYWKGNSDVGSLTLVVPGGATNLTGKLVLGDLTTTTDVSVDVKVLVDGQAVKSGTLTPAQPFVISQDVAGHRRVDLHTTIVRGGSSENGQSDVAVVFVEGFVQ